MAFCADVSLNTKQTIFFVDVALGTYEINSFVFSLVIF